MERKIITLGPGYEVTLEDFESIIEGKSNVELSKKSIEKIEETRRFVEHLLKIGKRVYGLTTGFADLRDFVLEPKVGGLLSHNILQSHDAGIGKHLSFEETLGAMFLRVNNLSQGISGFSMKNLNVLLKMLNHRIVPLVPETGSLGASGDLCLLARLGRTMECNEGVKVFYGDSKTIVDVKTAFEKEGIDPAVFLPKEGLALTNGTSFSASIAAVSYIRLIHVMENLFGVVGMSMNAAGIVNAAYFEPVSQVRKQIGQMKIAGLLLPHLKDSPFCDKIGVQDDYLYRCIPQIFGYHFELMGKAKKIITREMNAITDNPLIFRGKEVEESSINKERIIPFEGKDWCVLSGGNFHAEYVAQICDSLSRANVKPILTLERHLTYLMNPARGGKLKKENIPTYLITDKEKTGLNSGFMIVQYTANAIAQKIAMKGLPGSLFNITSANESEDVVSFGTSIAQKLFEQVQLMEEFLVVYTTEILQAYSIARSKVKPNPENLSEKVYLGVMKKLDLNLPLTEDQPFDGIYKKVKQMIDTDVVREVMSFPLKN